MTFYNFLEQQYKYYKSKYGILPTSCEGCPCKALRYRLREQKDCRDDIIYLANKYNIHDFNFSSCDDRIAAAVKIAKKMSEISNRI